MDSQSLVEEIAEITLSTNGGKLRDSALLERMGRDVGFDIGFFIRQGSIRPGGVRPGTMSASPSSKLTATSQSMMVYRRELAPVFARAARQRRVAVDRDTLGSKLERTTLFQRFMRPHQGYTTALIVLPYTTIALGRCTKTPFSHVELDLLRSAAPFLGMAELGSVHHGAALVEPARATFGLTAREQEVLEYLQRGMTNPEIAQLLGTSPHTVRNQLRSVFRKLGATTRAEAVAVSLGAIQ